MSWRSMKATFSVYLTLQLLSESVDLGDPVPPVRGNPESAHSTLMRCVSLGPPKISLVNIPGANFRWPHVPGLLQHRRDEDG